MWLHYLLFLLICFISITGYIFSKRKQKNIFVLITVFALFFVIATFRDIGVGNDTIVYYRFFNEVYYCNSFLEAVDISRFEIGYVFLNYFVAQIGGNFTVLLGFISIIYLSSIFRFIGKYALSNSIAILLTFTFSMFYDLLNVGRQCLAVAIFLYGIDYLIQRNFVKYLVIIIFASLFHTTSFFMIFLYFLPAIDLKYAKNFIKWSILFLLFLVALQYSASFLTNFLPYYAHYLNSIYSEGEIRLASIAFLLIRIFVIVIIYFFKGDLQNQKHGEQSNLTVFSQLVFMECFVAGASIAFNLLDRFENYFCLGFIIFVSNAISSMKSRNRLIAKLLIIIVTMIYLSTTLTLRNEWYGIFPYQFIN